MVEVGAAAEGAGGDEAEAEANAEAEAEGAEKAEAVAGAGMASPSNRGTMTQECFFLPVVGAGVGAAAFWGAREPLGAGLPQM